MYGATQRKTARTFHYPGMDYQILVEADFLVNLFENETSRKPAEMALERIFKTETGKEICKTMFLE